MGTTGLIYVAIVAAWAAYLVPMWLRRHDEVRRRKAVEQYSEAMRVLSRQTDSLDRTRYVARPLEDRLVAPPPKRSAESLRARRVATMRRRRVLSLLTLSLLSVSALAAFALVPPWAVGVPGGLLVVFFATARLSVRRMRRRDRGAITRRLRKASRVAVSHLASDEPAAPSVAAAEVSEPPAEGLWDPVPVTLPTYVYKEKAIPRTVRTVDLSEPDVFSSAPDASEPLPEPAAEPASTEVPRAVGD